MECLLAKASVFFKGGDPSMERGKGRRLGYSPGRGVSWDPKRLLQGS